MGLQTCGEIRTLSLAKLQSECGVKTGQMLHDNTVANSLLVRCFHHERCSASGGHSKFWLQF